MKSSHLIRIVTCCYCGGRSTLEHSRGRNLICHGCGASISRIEAIQPVLERAAKPKNRKKKPAIPHPAEGDRKHLAKDRPARRKKGKRRRGMWYHVREAFDDLDDLDDLFDIFD